jgi:hypothetical protein
MLLLFASSNPPTAAESAVAFAGAGAFAPVGAVILPSSVAFTGAATFSPASGGATIIPSSVNFAGGGLFSPRSAVTIPTSVAFAGSATFAPHVMRTGVPTINPNYLLIPRPRRRSLIPNG